MYSMHALKIVLQPDFKRFSFSFILAVAFTLSPMCIRTAENNSPSTFSPVCNFLFHIDLNGMEKLWILRFTIDASLA